MKAHGATTLWEYMHGRLTGNHGSQNHPMFGAVVQQFFDGFLGIRQCKDSYGYQAFEICPKIPYQMQSAKGFVTLPCGKVSVAWTRMENSITIKITLPEHANAVCVYNGQTYPLQAGTQTTIKTDFCKTTKE